MIDGLQAGHCFKITSRNAFISVCYYIVLAGFTDQLHGACARIDTAKFIAMLHFCYCLMLRDRHEWCWPTVIIGHPEILLANVGNVENWISNPTKHMPRVRHRGALSINAPDMHLSRNLRFWVC